MLVGLETLRALSVFFATRLFDVDGLQLVGVLVSVVRYLGVRVGVRFGNVKAENTTVC